ncbi:alpha-xenorhabdolysin family binary toxin subunit A [Nocardiopsis sp. YSL2]|uniref:alpha-xenorhabdolysin family binary toxin subunit A n=1 Tax=Nocardiopsis sp. YSL2 TaxID=2939492 RepID=UPI0026F4450E|nr:alpha-xenorhabdolysin family binary toxin subunit A [Nocardiopsis sp. YSL2]
MGNNVIELREQAKQFVDQSGPKQRFALADGDMYTVQAYCIHVMGLPLTHDELKTRLGLLKEDDTTEFSDLLQQYQAMSEHVKKWDSVTQDTVSLANGISNYGRQAATVYYKKLAELAEQGLEDEARKKKFLAILDNRAEEAKKFAEKAAKAAADVAEFHQATAQDSVSMEKLKQTYDTRYDNDNEEWKKVDDEIKKLQDDLKKEIEDFNAECMADGKRPWYEWAGFVAELVSPGGGLARVTKLNDCRKAIKETEDKIGVHKGLLERNTRIRASTKSALDSISGTAEIAKKAEGVLGRMRSGWQRIAENLDSIRDLVDTDIRKVQGLVDLQIEQAVSDWENVGQMAQKYADTAFVDNPGRPAALAA